MHSGQSGYPLSRHHSNTSNMSMFSEVEMAQDEVYAGPISESVPSSATGFIHRRSRADSTTSFTYFPDKGTQETPSDESVFDDVDEEDDYHDRHDLDIEQGTQALRPRKSSAYSRISIEDALLRRSDSAQSGRSEVTESGRISQKIHLVSEDLTIVIAGFETRRLGLVIYGLLCIVTGGLAYLVFRWLPRWRVALVGTPKPLCDCSWVVIENQWGEFTVQNIGRRSYGHSLSSVFGTDEKLAALNLDEDGDPLMTHLNIIDYRYIRFYFHPLKDKFVFVHNWKDPSWTNVKSTRTGLEAEERHRREQVFGRNMIEIREKSIPQLLVDEAFHPFYVFQVASLILWSLDEYYYYAICIFLISLTSILTTLLETRSTMRRLRNLSSFQCATRVLRSGFWRQIMSSELVPGDVYEVSDPSLSHFPCDSLLLAGDCIANESMLTGESVPVSKVPATDQTLLDIDLGATSISSEVAKHFLFCGTKIIRARRPQDGLDEEAVALAVVVRTGFSTTKGALVRSMLFPKPSGFKFYKDAFRYISVMAVIAGSGFIASLINFIRLKLAVHLIVVRALDLITIVVPPALPATLSIGTNFALSRLKQKYIFCISPQRVNVGGKLDIICFDKTGTLTEDGLDVLGVRVVHKPAMRFSDVLSDVNSLLPAGAYERDPTVDYGVHRAILNAMATCHALRTVGEAIIGDPLDQKMFEFTGWSLEENMKATGNSDFRSFMDLTTSTVRPPPGSEYEPQSGDQDTRPIAIELSIVKTFEFVSQLRRASVVAYQTNSTDLQVFVKGAPECMKDICHVTSFPLDYEELLSFYTHRGFRVIACATKTLEGLDPRSLEDMPRNSIESDLQFIGFIIFENKLKPVSRDVIDELNMANIRSIMCTGDNILTAISVARECSLVERTAHCYIPQFETGHSKDPRATLKWHSVDNPLFELDQVTLQPLAPPAEEDASSPYEVTNLRNYSLAITGDAFRWIVEYGQMEVLHRILARGQVFARMSPDEKHELVEKLQSIDYCCGFCGDGANDCGALKAADVGISLSEAEASVAAPFTSRIFNISCVPQVIREGRAALVTSFCCFKYMSLYSAIQFTSVSFLYASGSNLGDFQYLFIDLFLILPIAIFMGWTGPYDVICRRRPTASLVSRKVLTPLLGQVLVCIIVQTIVFQLVCRQLWYIPPQLNVERSNIENSQNTSLFLLSCYQYILSGVVLSVGPPFRQTMTNNLPFVAMIISSLLFASYLLFDPAAWLVRFMQLTTMSTRFKIDLLAVAGGGFAFAWIAEQKLFPLLASFIGRIHDNLWPQRRKKRKQYKLIYEKMLI